MKDYYQILNISENANMKEIKKSYRQLVAQLHPDKKLNSSDSESFQQIIEAYSVLSNVEKKKHYDIKRSVFMRIASLNKESACSDTTKKTQEADQKPTSLDAYVHLKISLEDAFFGCTKHIQFDRKKNQQIEKKQLSIDVPKGITHGSCLRLKGESHQINGQSGDLFIKVKIQKHSVFNVINHHDLWMILPLSFADAILGSCVNIPSLDGDQLQIAVQPNTFSGKLLKLKEQGFYKKNSSQRGDLFLEIRIDIPAKIKEEERKWIEQFRKTQNLCPLVSQFHIYIRKLSRRRAS